MIGIFISCIMFLIRINIILSIGTLRHFRSVKLSDYILTSYNKFIIGIYLVCYVGYITFTLFAFIVQIFMEFHLDWLFIWWGWGIILLQFCFRFGIVILLTLFILLFTIEISICHRRSQKARHFSFICLSLFQLFFQIYFFFKFTLFFFFLLFLFLFIYSKFWFLLVFFLKFLLVLLFVLIFLFS